MAKNSESLVYLLIGAGLGLIGGVLFAPGKGQETRKKIADEAKKRSEEASIKASELKEEFGKKTAELKEEINKKTADLRKELEKQAEIGKTKINKFKDTLKKKSNGNPEEVTEEQPSEALVVESGKKA
jgi:gas vesicle protein